MKKKITWVIWISTHRCQFKKRLHSRPHPFNPTYALTGTYKETENYPIRFLNFIRDAMSIKRMEGIRASNSSILLVCFGGSLPDYHLPGRCEITRCERIKIEPACHLLTNSIPAIPMRRTVTATVDPCRLIPQ